MSVVRPIFRACCKLGGARAVNYLARRFERNSANGRSGFPYVVKRKQRSLQILTYHRVNDDGDICFPGTPTRLFAQQMEYLADSHRVLDLAEAAERLAANDIPDNAIVITFDDGYRDNFSNALPILDKLALPATIFLATGVIGSDRLLWHDRVFNAFRETQLPQWTGFAESRCYSLAKPEERVAALESSLKVIFTLGESERDRCIDRLVDQLQVAGRREQSGLMLSWDEVAQMSRKRIAFGSHTVTHPILTRVPADRIAEEMATSKKLIEQRLGNTVKAFAYPKGGVGDFDATTRSLLIDAGYRCAVTTLFGGNKPGQDPFELKRGTPWEQDIDSFAVKLAWYRFIAA